MTLVSIIKFISVVLDIELTGWTISEKEDTKVQHPDNVGVMLDTLNTLESAKYVESLVAPEQLAYFS